MNVMLKIWLRFKDAMVGSEYLFPARRSNNVLSATNFERNFRKYVERADLNKKITPHGLRNNFVRKFLVVAKDIYSSSKILGHSSVLVTEKSYLYLTDEDLRSSY